MAKTSSKTRIEQKQPREILIARWCIARCLRSMGRFNEAYEEQLRLRDEFEVAEKEDGFVYEEIVECLFAQGRENEVRPYAAEAYRLLKAESWMDTDRLKRLAAFSEIRS